MCQQTNNNKLTPYEAHQLAKSLTKQDNQSHLVWLIVPKNGNYPYCQVTNKFEMPIISNKLLENPINNKDFLLELLEIIKNDDYIIDNTGEN